MASLFWLLPPLWTASLTSARDCFRLDFLVYRVVVLEMLVPNWPRFVYERDTLVLSAKVVNLTSDHLKGNVVLQCYDAATGKP